MTGQELIDWLHEHNAEDKEIIIEHRDSGGTYGTAERLGEFVKPELVNFMDESYGIIYRIIRNTDNPMAIIL